MHTKKHPKRPVTPSLEEHRHQQTEGDEIYAQLKEEEKLRQYHIGKLLLKPGYEHLTEEMAADLYDQMLRLCCIIYDIMKREAATDSINYSCLKKSQRIAPDFKPKAT